MRNRRWLCLPVTKRRSVLVVQTLPPLASAALVFRQAECARLGARLGLRTVTPVVPAPAATTSGAGAAITGTDPAEAGLDLSEAGVEAYLFLA
jgi:hypothetical protein